MKAIPVILFLSFWSTAMAQDLSIDLSVNNDGTTEQNIEKQSIKNIVLENTVLNSSFSYEVTVEVQNVSFAAFPSNYFLTAGAAPPAACKPLDDLVQKAKATDSEAEIRKLKQKIIDEIEKAPAACSTFIAEARKVLNYKTIKPLAVMVSLKECQTLTLTVTRTNNADGKKKKWIYKFNTECESPWKVHYGFTYSLDVLNPVTNYYSKRDTGSTYIISSQNNQRNDFLRNLTPTVMFTYRPKHTYKGWRGALSNDFYKLGFVGGIGLNLESPTAMVGPSIVIKENLSMSFGLIAVQKPVLRGQYTSGQHLTESLDFDQLHEDRYMLEFFFSIGFRFDQNPFKKEQNEEDKKHK